MLLHLLPLSHLMEGISSLSWCQGYPGEGEKWGVFPTLFPPWTANWECKAGATIVPSSRVLQPIYLANYFALPYLLWYQGKGISYWLGRFISSLQPSQSGELGEGYSVLRHNVTLAGHCLTPYDVWLVLSGKETQTCHFSDLPHIRHRTGQASLLCPSGHKTPVLRLYITFHVSCIWLDSSSFLSLLLLDIEGYKPP